MKDIRELMEWVKLKVRGLNFFVKDGRIIDPLNVMAIELGRQDKISTYPVENDLEIRFYSLSDFIKHFVGIDRVGIEADINLGNFSYSKQYFYHALKIVKDPEIGIPNIAYPLIIRNNTCSVFIGPKTDIEKIDAEKIDIRKSEDIDITDPNLVEELHFMKEELGAIIIDHYGNTKFWLHISPDLQVPYILDYEDEKIRVSLIKPNEVVIEEEELTMVINYPLSVDARLDFKKKGGFTRIFIFKSIYEAYKQIYEEEDEECGDPGTYNNLYNRSRSEGKYGIWGHYLEDLVIESVSYDPKRKELYMFIGS
ncbi:hypothetical protein LCGC14_1191200 [marine sediment metagenome]|uniref:Uncharacterized protein n=1 Tax=marine sediment metagenome TaxID=412755 RepID=A0A0F9LP14_9ZZZZ